MYRLQVQFFVRTTEECNKLRTLSKWRHR